MNKRDLIDKIVKELDDNDCIDWANYPSRALAFAECSKVIEKVLKDYIIIQGELLD